MNSATTARCSLLMVLVAMLAGCAGKAASKVDDVFAPFADEAASAGVDLAWLVTDEDGEAIFAHRAEHLVHPASTLKLVTAAVAMEAGLAEREFVTRVVGWDSAIRMVWLVGGGDPLLSSEDLRRLAQAVPDAWLSGPLTVRLDTSLFRGPRFGSGWMWDDEPAPFLPHLSALTVDGACMSVTATASDGVITAKVANLNEIETPRIEALVLPDADPEGADLSISRAFEDGSNQLVITGALPPGGTGTRRLSVVDPVTHAGKIFVQFLRDRGATSVFFEPEGAQEAVTTAPDRDLSWITFDEVRRPATSVLKPLLADSDNLVAECLLRMIPVWSGSPFGSDALGLEHVRAFLKERGIDEKTFRIVDGSGVSHYNLVTPRLLVTCLTSLLETPVASAMAGPGVGTLAGRMEGLSTEQVRAKTGTVSGVSCLAGYVTDKSGEQRLFAIMVQNFVGSARRWRALQDAMVARLVESR